MHSNEQQEVEEAYAGDIVAMIGEREGGVSRPLI